MALLGIPNISEGRRQDVIDHLARAVGEAGASVLDIHSDPVHDRSVLTLTGSEDALIDGLTSLAESARDLIDLTTHTGVHPRLGVLDVSPIVPHNASMERAVDVARAVGRSIGAVGIPVFLYGAAARRARTRELPDIRRGGLAALVARIGDGLEPDHGPVTVEPRTGVVCVGARPPLIAFNVWIRCPVEVARRIAASVRTSGGGPRGIRALGLPIDDAPTSQVALNLTEPWATGIDEAFEAVRRHATSFGAEIVATEIVGLVERRFMPRPDAQAARLLMAPGRSVESALAG